MEQSVKKDWPVLLTCAQPTGGLHVGNYFGAINQWKNYLSTHECFFGIVDMHAITLPYVPAQLRKNSLECLAQYIACGLEPQSCHLFLQSHVSGHAELAWILGCLCPIGRLERMTQYKDKTAKQEGFVGSGLLYYPILMAADILLYNADIVPTGEDQLQHLELTRDLASKFNETYSPTFKEPQPRVPQHAGRIMSLQNPEEKMSKSDPHANGTLYLLDGPDILRKKIKSAVTDSGSEIRAGEDKPGVTNLLNLLALASGSNVETLQAEWAGKGYAPFKEAVAEAVVEKLQPVQQKYYEIAEDKTYLSQTLKEGADSAQKKANRTLSKVYRKAGFVERPRE